MLLWLVTLVLASNVHVLDGGEICRRDSVNKQESVNRDFISRTAQTHQDHTVSTDKEHLATPLNTFHVFALIVHHVNCFLDIRQDEVSVSVVCMESPAQFAIAAELDVDSLRKRKAEKVEWFRDRWK